MNSSGVKMPTLNFFQNIIIGFNTAMYGNPKSMKSNRSCTGDLDFDEEAKRLWDRLNLDPTAHSRGKWNPLDPIWRHPDGGGIIYVGNQTAAEDIRLLNRHGITHGMASYIFYRYGYFSYSGKLYYWYFTNSQFPRKIWSHQLLSISCK